MEKLQLQDREYGNIEMSLNYLKTKIPSKNPKILDIGCSYGSLVNHLYKTGYKDVYGIETNENHIQKGRKEYPKLSKRIKCYEGSVLPYENCSFDVVLMFDVIEHIPNVKDFLREQVYRVLRKNGTFIFQTPNKYINIPWEIINSRSFIAYKQYHCSLQTRKQLEQTLLKIGFKDIVIEKNNIITQHNKNKVRKKLGPWAIPLLYILQRLPLNIYPNLWGYAKK